MTPRDDHRAASGRLAPPRPDFGWGTPSTSHHAHQHPDQHETHLDQHAESEYWSNDSHELYNGQVYLEAPVTSDHRRGTGTFEIDDDSYEEPARVVEHEISYVDSYGEESSHSAPVETEPVSAREPIRRQQPEYVAQYAPQYPAQDAGPGMLSMQERQQLLMHTIQLYDDEWKLAGIRANQRKNWLQGYLTPRSKHLDLKEAISRNQVLIITIDSRGNTDINEPKKPGPWRRLTWWIFGG